MAQVTINARTPVQFGHVVYVLQGILIFNMQWQRLQNRRSVDDLFATFVLTGLRTAFELSIKLH